MMVMVMDKTELHLSPRSFPPSSRRDVNGRARESVQYSHGHGHNYTESRHWDVKGGEGENENEFNWDRDGREHEAEGEGEEIEDEHAPPLKKRRRKYIAKACNECKHRKIKCNGEKPCQRCGRQRIECIYENRPENGVLDTVKGFEHLCAQMNAMQEQITLLSAAVHTLTQNQNGGINSGSGGAGLAINNGNGSGNSISNNMCRSESRPYRRIVTTAPKEHTFQGPTTSAFSFDLAKSSLQKRGIVDNHDGEGDLTREPSPVAAPIPGSPTALSSTGAVTSASRISAMGGESGDPLWNIGRTEAQRLCRVYEEEMGVMYPVVDLEQLLQHVQLLYGPTGAAGSWPRAPVRLRGGAGGRDNGSAELDSDDVNILRLVFACALTAEASGSSELAMSLFDSVRDAADNCVWGTPEIKNITLLTLVAIFYFQIDEETLAWRTIGTVQRMCLEKGLHRRETLKQPAVLALGRDRVLRLFWSVHILDMRWSFGTGMPFAVDDADIDPWLPEPDEKTSYLRVMIRYSRIAAKVWKFISAFNNTNEIKKDEMDYLDWQVMQWITMLPDSLRLNHPSPDHAEGETRSLRRLRSLVYLRGNQLRMLIHRPVLQSATQMVRYPTESQTVVNMAKDTIRFITQLHATSDIYQLQQVVFNWFLVSALVALFLAVAQNPSQYSATCREEFYMALELVKGVSTRSYISRRLWKSIKGLRRLGPKLMHRQGDGDGDRGPDGEQRGVGDDGFDQAPTSSVQSQTPQDGAQMTQELQEWFEAVGNLEDQIMGVGMETLQEGGGGGGPGFMFDYGGELSSLMKDCF